MNWRCHRPWRLALLAAALAAGLCGTAPGSIAKATPVQRVVSMNLCTDQLALLIAAPEQIHSVSYISHDPRTAVLADRARHYPANHGLAEEIFLMKPDLILAGAFTRRATTQLLVRLGFRVETFYPARSFDDIRANITRMGRLLGRMQKAAALNQAFDSALAALDRPATRKRAALYHANNYTSGSGTLASDIVRHAGLENLGDRLGLAGMVKLPLELLIVHAPDIIIAEERGSDAEALAYQNFSHPALRHAAKGSRALVRTDKSWSCGGPFTIDAVRRLAGVATRLLEDTKQ